MADVQVAKYSIGYSFEIDRTSITRLNAQITRIKKSIETKLNNLNVTGIKINAVSLNRALQQASTNIVLPINNFNINVVALRQQVQAAFSRGVPLRVNAVTSGAGPSGGGSRGAGGRRGGSNLESIAQFGSRAIPAFAGFAGLSSINNTSQAIASNRMSLNTVSQGRGVDAYDWIRRNSNEMGVNFMEALPAFNNYIASSINKQGYDNTLQSYKDITGFGLTRGATNESMGRANYAIGQMWSQGKVKSEELNLQLSEAKGFGGVKELFAQAYQESTGGSLTGQKAEAALAAAMKKGNVLTADVLPIVTRLMGEQSKGSIGVYQQSTAAAQNRAKNALTDTIEKFGKSGFDTQMARFFNNLSKWLENSDELVRKLGNGFSILIDFMEALVETGAKVFNFFNSISPSITMATLVLGPLAKIIGGTGLAFLALALAMDDISHFVDGKDSVFGNVIGYLQDLTGFDWTGIATGIGIVGTALLVAFAPLTALALSIGALVMAFDYLQKLKAKEKAIDTNAATLPTYAELNAQSLRNADKAWTDNPSFSTGIDKANAIFGSLTSPIGGKGLFAGTNGDAVSGAFSASSGFKNKLHNLTTRGILSEEENERVLTAIGGGYSTEAAMMGYLEKRGNYNHNSAGSDSASFRIGVVNVTANDPMEFTNSIKSAMPDFSAKTTISPTGN